MNITDGIWRNSHAWPDRLAVIYDAGSLSYLALRRLCGLVASRLAEAGIVRGDCVALAVHSPLAHVVLVIATARIGAISTPLRGRKPDSLRDELLERHDAKWVVQDAKEGWRSPVLTDGAYLQVADLFRPFEPHRDSRTDPPAADADNDAWYIALSSGTTGTPKSIPQTHGKSALSFALGRASYSTAEERCMVLADLSVYMGLGNVLRGLVMGQTMLITAHADSETQFKLIERHRPTRLSTTTAIAGSLVAYAHAHLRNSRTICQSIVVMSVAGASVPPALREGILLLICPQLEIAYGATEFGGMALATTQTLATRPSSAGRVRDWVDAEVVDERDQVLPRGTQGILRFRSATAASGYLNDPDTTAKMFRNGWYYPGDTGAIDQAGYVTLGGRTDHVLNLGGKKLDPVQIENVLNAHPCVTEAVVVAAVPDGGHIAKLVAVVVLASPVEKSELKRHCRDALGDGLAPREIVFVEALPKNAGGKIMRAELAARVRIGTSGGG